MKVAVVFGGTYEMYLKHAKVLDFFEKRFEKIDDTLYSHFGHEIRVFFAFGPKPCEPLEFARRHVREAEEHYPPSAEEVVKEVKRYKPVRVLFFRIAGGIRADLNRIYYPTEFYEFYFRRPWLIHEQGVFPKNRIVIRNLLGNDRVRVLTTNFVFNKYSVGPGEKKEEWASVWKEVEEEMKRRNLNYRGKRAAEKWCEIVFYERFLPKLKGFGDLVDMESYVFAKSFKRVGIMLQVSDVVGEVELTFERKTVDWKKFNESVVFNVHKLVKNEVS